MPNPQPAFERCVKLVAVSGSLNPTSANSAVLRSAAQHSYQVQVWEELGQLPYFSPGAAPTDAVASLCRVLGEADGVWFSTPEYAGGMPGALKNALDWLVESGALYDKPVVITSAAPNLQRGHNARRWVQEVVQMQGARVLDSFTIAIPPGVSPQQVAAEAQRATARVREAFANRDCD